MTSQVQTELKALLGASGWVDAGEAGGYAQDWLQVAPSSPLGVARPNSVDLVARIVSYCAENALTLVPQGGNTGLVLGSVPAENNACAVILSLDRLNQISNIDPIGKTVEVESGVVLAELQRVLEPNNLTLPLHLGSEGSAQIGGLISTNAGGCHAFRYGMMADQVLGLEVVLPNGDIWQGNRALIKDNAGYSLKRLFCGAEGTLGIITSATLKLIHKPASSVTALVACTSLQDALAILTLSETTAGHLLHAAEFIDSAGIKLLQQHCPQVKMPLDEIPNISLLLEFASPSHFIALDPLVEQVLDVAMENGWASDGVVAANRQQQMDLWELRESIPEGQRLHGAQLKHDVSVPVAALPEFIQTASNACRSIMNSVLINPFGHLADGNVHFNLSAPQGEQEAFISHSQAFNNAVYHAAVEFNGSFAAEHGLGRSKVALADKLRSPVERSLMRTLKRAIDPDEIMNPGVILHAVDEVPDVSG